MDITSEIIEVTPALAAEWLKNNPKNRSLNPKTVADYARQMVAGDWMMNGESIKRATNQALLDGQHRLAAVVLSRVTVDMLVIEGLAPELQDTMDAGRKRTAADSFAIGGEGNATVLAAVARRVWMWDQGLLRFPSSPTPSTVELRAVLDRYPTLRRSAEIGSRTFLSFRPSRQAVTGTAHHLFNRIDPALTAEFFAQLGSGAGLEQGHPVLTLRERITRDKLVQRNVPFHLGVALYIRSWNALREDRTLGKLIHGVDDPMVMPV